ncbi:MAG TPA: AraC family transcriptional regulator [Gammaproteobacteria bacterium]|jgi:AraC-like DNA-binding protein|nr:AraC family transcriptional regulator [Gammaproteobacteria bacterium]
MSLEFHPLSKHILVVPQGLEDIAGAVRLAETGGSAVYYKDLEQDLTNVEFYTNTPCLIYIKAGREVITTSSNEALDLGTGSVVFLRQGVNLYSDYVRRTSALKAYMLFFGESVIEAFSRSHALPQTADVDAPDYYRFVDAGALAAYFETLRVNHALGVNTPELFAVKLRELMHLLVAQDERAVASLFAMRRETLPPKRNLARLLAEPEAFRLAVSDLARLSGRSLSSFNRDFKTLFDMPPKKWLQQQRMSHSKTLLQSEHYSVTEVANLVGYENVSHFIKAFKTCYGMTPKQIKQHPVTSKPHS